LSWLRLAKGISWVTNPCILSVTVLLVAGYTESGGERLLLGETLVILVCLVLLPAVYVYLRLPAATRTWRRPAELTEYLRTHPRDVIVLAIFFGLPCLIILATLEEPPLVVITLVVLLATSLVVAVANLFRRVSYHLAAITSLAVMAGLIWEHALPVALAVVPLVAWAKYTMRHHTPVQLALGFGLAALVSLVTAYVSGTLFPAETDAVAVLPGLI
jgi:hypothetical protein